jgi:hypothetical protein
MKSADRRTGHQLACSTGEVIGRKAATKTSWLVRATHPRFVVIAGPAGDSACSLALVALSTGNSLTWMKEWSRWNRWVGRAAAWDADNQRIRRVQHTNERRPDHPARGRPGLAWAHDQFDAATATERNPFTLDF